MYNNKKEIDNSYNIKKMQDKLFFMLIEFHNVCCKHNIKYFMIGGTMLGAIRHKNFIPWDDDIDIGLPRREYEKLLSLPSSEWPSNIEINSPINIKDYPYAFSKMVDNSTTLVETLDIDIDYTQGIYIDIFPIDGVGNIKKDISRQQKKVDLIKRFICISNLSIKSRRNVLKKILIILIKIINKQKLQYILRNQLLKRKYECSNYVGNLLGAWGEKEVMPKEYFGEPRLYSFRDKLFFGPEKCEQYLTALYGDYMKLPSVEKQKSHHSFKSINLDLSYNKYLESIPVIHK